MRKKEAGFTLIEVVLVIVITGLLASVAGRMMSVAFSTYFEVGNQSSLLDNADIVRRRLGLDLRQALPNSVRIGCQNRCLELMHIKDSGRYRAATNSTEDILAFGVLDSRFELMGLLQQTVGAHSIRTGNGVNDCRDNQADCLVVLNTGVGAQDVYQGGNRATITDLLPTNDPTHLQFVPRVLPAPSPAQHFYVVDTPITYICDVNAATLRRYDGYRIQRNQSDVDSHNELLTQGASDSLLSNQIQACEFRFQPGDTVTGGIVMLEIRLGNAAQTYPLFAQIALDAVP